MKCYKVHTKLSTRYAASQTDARAKRDDIVARTDCNKKDVQIDQIDVDTSKTGVIETLNAVCASYEELGD